jgi:hypothetical protein
MTESQEKKQESIDLQARFSQAKEVESLNDLEELRKTLEAYSFVSVRKLGQVYILVPFKDNPSEKMWITYNGEDLEMINLIADWMQTATKMFTEKPRSREEMNYLRLMYLSFTNVFTLLKLENEQQLQMFSMMCQAIAEKWMAADKVEASEANCHIYMELVAKYVHTLSNLIAQAQTAQEETK